MKKVLYFVSALAMVLVAGSCQNETLEINADNGMVTFTVEAPGVFKATKATEAINTTIADGRNVNQLIYEVWTLDANGDLETRLFQDNTKTLELVDGTRQTTLALELLNDQKYAILFWAQVNGTGAYNTADLRQVSYANALNDGYFTNDEALAAFYAVAYINDGKHVAEDLVTPTNGTVKLRRPFAQLNLGTINNSAKLPYDIKLEKSSLTVKGIATEFNVFDSSVKGAADVTLKANAVPAAPTTLTVQGVTYEYAAMTYLFAGDVVEVTYNIETSLRDKANPDPTSVVSASVNNSDNPICSVPLKENYRTNIVGNLLTTSAEYKIIVDAAWAQEDDEPYNKFLSMSAESAEALVEAVNTIENGGIITLSSDIALTSTIDVPETKAFTMNLDGYTLTTPLQEGSTTNHAYAFNNYGEMTITDTKGNGAIVARGIFNYGKITLNSGTICACDANGGYAIRNYKGAEFVMNGGSVITNNEDGDEPANGYDATTIRVDEGATATINNGVVNNISNFTFAIDNYGTLTVNGGQFTSIHTTVWNEGEAVINGGTFVCNGLEGITAHCLVAENGSETTINGGTFDGKDNYNGFNVDASKGAVVNITGGEFLPVHSGSLYGDGTINVTGGVYFDDPTARLATGYSAQLKEDGKYHVAI